MQKGVKVNDLHQTVDACIRAPGTIDTYGLSRELAQCAFEFVLNGIARALALPALVGATAVSDTECNSHLWFTGRSTC